MSGTSGSIEKSEQVKTKLVFSMYSYMFALRSRSGLRIDSYWPERLFRRRWHTGFRVCTLRVKALPRLPLILNNARCSVHSRLLKEDHIA